MPGGLPIIYRSGSGNLTFNVDYVDYAANAGYKKFYCGGAAVSGAAVFFLSPQQIPSSMSAATLWIQATNQISTKTFDMTFNNPARVTAADALAEFTTNSATSTNLIVRVSINHVRGAVVTEFGMKETESFLTGTTEFQRNSLVIPVTAQAFSPGDKLRVITSLNENNSVVAKLYHDPSSRDTFTENGTGATIGSDLVVSIPFKIDL